MGAKVKVKNAVTRPIPELILIRDEKNRIREVWKKLWKRAWIPIEIAEAAIKAIFGARMVRVIEINELQHRYEEFNPKEEYLKKMRVL